ncbi:hypothetical protein M405DRAFT_806864 [Rhizopogon salebrosus TDB-379]|nr:hypothetical protein M405DRAFT_806864 [Rhizopogon salebrosus TDB-379]
MLAAAFRLGLFWLYFTRARCAGLVVAVGPVSLPSTISTATSSHSATSTSPSSNSSHAMTSTSASAVPSSTPGFFINAIKNMTTCTSGVITWTYTGSSPNLVLSITNIDVFDPYLQGNTRRQNTAGQNIFETLILTNATSNSWTWPQVNVSQGWYQIQGTVAPTSAASTPFFISNGTDTSCLLVSSSPATSTGTASPTAVGNYSNSTQLKTPEIIGIVLGVVAGLGILALLIVYYLRRHRRRPSPGSLQRHKHKENMGRWGSLKSNSSTAKSLVGGNADVSTVHSDGTELGSELQISVANITSPAEEKVEPYHPSQSQETTPSDSIHTPPSSYDRHMSLFSLPNPPVPSNPQHRRRASEVNFEQHAARIRSSMDSSMHLRTERLSFPAFPRTPTSATRGRDEYPPSPAAELFPYRGRDEYPPSPRAATSHSRSPSASRRMPRKPVPHYDPSELRDNTGDSQLVLSGGDLPGTDTLPPLLHDSPALSHKASLGNHPRMHYLIPDMPPPSSE